VGNPNVFVSHAHQDGGFVSLLVKLLKFHEIDAWYSEFELQGGERFRDAISNALAHADAMIVVASASAVRSKWVLMEVATFQAQRPARTVIPLCIDETAPSSVDESLSQFQHVDFARSMSAGFDDLLRAFGRQFLVPEHTSPEKRRNNRRSRSGFDAGLADRRKSPLIARMRKGCWFTFYRETELDKYSEFRLNVRNMDKLVRGLAPEVDRYTFIHKVTRVIQPGRQVLMNTATRLWERLRDWEQLSTIHVVEAVVEEMNAEYDVSTSGRRTSDRRSDANKPAHV
jgi:TIR domain